MILEAAARQRSERPEDILRDIENRAYSQELADPAFAVWVAAQWFVGQTEGWSTAADTRASYHKWCTRFPDDGTLALNNAGTAMGLGDEAKAEREINRAEQLHAPPFLIHRFRGNLAWNRHEPKVALHHYARASGGFRRTAMRWQMGDCDKALDRRRRALHAYRFALRPGPLQGSGRRTALAGSRAGGACCRLGQRVGERRCGC